MFMFYMIPSKITEMLKCKICTSKKFFITMDIDVEIENIKSIVKLFANILLC